MAFLAWAVAVGGAPAAANSDGAVPGFTGGFGEATCRSCHFDAPAEPEAGGEKGRGSDVTPEVRPTSVKRQPPSLR